MENQVCIPLQIQEDQPDKGFTTQVVSLSSWDMFLPVLVYMQEQQNCSHKHYTIILKSFLIVTVEKVFRILTRKKHPKTKLQHLRKV